MGAGQAVRRAGGEATQPPWACLPRPPSHEGRGRGTRSRGLWRRQPPPPAPWSGARARVRLAPAVGSPRCSQIARTPPACFTSASTRRLPPRLTQAKRVQRKGPAQQSRESLLAASSPSSAPTAPCLWRHARLLCSYLRTRHAPLLRSCLGERASPWRSATMP